VFQREGELFNNQGRVVGRGKWACAVLESKEKIVGYIVTDNLRSQKPINTQLLALWAHTLGHLCLLRKAQEVLQKNEERYRKLWDDAPVAYHTLNTDGIITNVNKTESKMLGYRPEEMIGRPFFDFVLPAQREEAKDRFRRGMAGEVLAKVDNRVYVKKDGSEVCVSIENNLEREGEKVIGTKSTMVDVTVRKQAEAALKESEEKYRLVVDNASEVIIVVQDGMFRLVNPAGEAIMGLSEQELKLTPFLSFVHPDDQAMVLDFYQKRLQGEDIPVRYIFRIAIKDGSIKWAEINSVRIDWKGCPAILSFLVDVTVRKQAEAALKEDEERFRALFETSQDSIFILDRETGRFISVNPAACRLYGYSLDEFLGMKHTDVSAEPEKTAAAVRNGVTTIPMRLHRKKDGSMFPVEIAGGYFMQGGNSLHTAFIRDISVRSQMENDLKFNLEKLQKTLAGTVSALGAISELRDPCTAGHQRRVAQLSGAIARQMGFSENDVEGIQIAGLLHDTGKIVVPAEILAKPGSLNKYEMGIVKTHSEVGYNLLKDVEFPWPIANIVFQHHERLDGSGYPYGITGKKIFMEAKILAVSDVVEAMSSHRPYRPALGINKALQEIVSHKGVLYDAEVVDACVSVFSEKKFDFKE
jgi:PAS domain S-box-containing protein/putative nucleotidyltransferase with HDIG domain